MLRFVMPNLFASSESKRLMTFFDKSSSFFQNSDWLPLIRGIISPFILRRLKREVLSQMMPKVKMPFFVFLDVALLA